MPVASHEGTLRLPHARCYLLIGPAAFYRYLPPNALYKATDNLRLFCMYDRHFWLFEQALHADVDSTLQERAMGR